MSPIAFTSRRYRGSIGPAKGLSTVSRHLAPGFLIATCLFWSVGGLS